MGLVLSQHWNKLKNINQTTKISSIVLLVSILLIGNRFALSVTNNAQIQSFITGLGTMIFIPYAISFTPLSKFLKSPLVNFMGKISYSFYLYHLPFLLISTSALYPIFHDFLIPMIISLIMSVFISYISYLIIEKKSMAIFKKIAHNLNPA
jgi:peptidoglycan/LPS O-acetylase OafA/YrhL